MNTGYFADQYGHIYRWEPTADGATSVPVANWQTSGNAKEAYALIDKANSASELLAALELAAVLHPHNETFRAAIAKARG